MTLANTASIAHAVVSLAQHGTPLAAGVLTHALRDDAAGVAARTAEAMGMRTERIDASAIEYHPGALNLVAVRQVEPAIVSGAPVLFVIENAYEASRCVVSALCSIIERRLEQAPCLVLVLTADISERSVLAEVTDGLEGHDVAIMRTSDENARLIEALVDRMGG